MSKKLLEKYVFQDGQFVFDRHILLHGCLAQRK